ncbi:MAG TPA: hypothetical protein VN706_18680 [Gemmatimonadaceae bacterium]|nr:hypothetical protein [Gemmatimonadaceae bacterium]
MRHRTVGIPWYRRQTYHTARAVFADRAALPASYDEWLRVAVEDERRVTQSGQVPVRAYIDPTELKSWCTSRGLPLDSRARREFAAKLAQETYLTSMDPAPVQVAYSNGREEVGIQIAPTVVEVGADGMLVALNDRLELDGRTVRVTAINQACKAGAAPDGSAEITVRLSFIESVRA